MSEVAGVSRQTDQCERVSAGVSERTSALRSDEHPVVRNDVDWTRADEERLLRGVARDEGQKDRHRIGLALSSVALGAALAGPAGTMCVSVGLGQFGPATTRPADFLYLFIKFKSPLLSSLLSPTLPLTSVTHLLSHPLPSHP